MSQYGIQQLSQNLLSLLKRMVSEKIYILDIPWTCIGSWETTSFLGWPLSKDSRGYVSFKEGIQNCGAPNGQDALK